MYASNANAATWTATNSPSVLGRGLQQSGTWLEDVYTNTHQGNRLPNGPVRADMVAAVFVENGASDRLLSVTVAAERATLTGADGASLSMGLAASTVWPLKIGPGQRQAHVRVTLSPHQAAGGSMVPVTFTFAARGPMTLMAPVWPGLIDVAPLAAVRTTLSR